MIDAVPYLDAIAVFLETLEPQPTNIYEVRLEQQLRANFRPCWRTPGNDMETRLREVDALAATGRLPEASLTEEGLSISPIRKNENEAADVIIRRLHAMLPRLRVTELFA